MIPLAVVYYGWHNATDDAKIRKLQPEVLVDNTPGGLWHGNCDVLAFPNIKIFSYITSSYSKYPLADNKNFIDAIALEGTYGVFMDELYPGPDAYLQAIYAYCQSKGLKLMVNPGMSAIDTGIYQYADFVMTDEHYTGHVPAPTEAGNLAKTVVIGFDPAWTPAQAAGYSNAAWANGYRYTWHEQVEYTSLPTQEWLDAYQAALTTTPAPIPTPPPVPPPVPPPTPPPVCLHPNLVIGKLRLATGTRLIRTTSTTWHVKCEVCGATWARVKV